MRTQKAFIEKRALEQRYAILVTFDIGINTAWLDGEFVSTVDR
uniref:Uncharacterized protein n=1 Tax=Nelumbo nucifera TaxID=4432 RepID=A0A822XXA5_NELNU|nr:TPA_asm: hypothetical protein HUJ06_026425 [Nelumbo nucifera]